MSPRGVRIPRGMKRKVPTTSIQLCTEQGHDRMRSDIPGHRTEWMHYPGRSVHRADREQEDEVWRFPFGYLWRRRQG